MFSQLVALVKNSFIDTVKVSLRVFKVVIPITILVKLLVEFDLIKFVAAPLEPIMSMVGVPTEYGLAWAAAIIVNLYSGLIVIAGLIPEIGLPTVAQASTLSLMCLFAHSMFIECKIAQECGVSFISQFIIRIAVAIFAGLVMHAFYILTGFHSQEATIMLDVQQSATLTDWAINELFNLLRIFILIWVVLVMHTTLTYLRITDFLEKILDPFLRVLGMSKETASTIVVGFCAGIVYGSGLIIKHSQENRMSKKDLFCGITLMGLAHALVEDTILMMLVGGSVWVTLGGRFLIVLLVGILISYIYDLVITRKQVSEIQKN